MSIAAVQYSRRYESCKGAQRNKGRRSSKPGELQGSDIIGPRPRWASMARMGSALRAEERRWKTRPRWRRDRPAAGGAKVVQFGPRCGSGEGWEIHTVELYVKVRLACADGMSQRAAARHFNISRDSVRKILAFSAPPGYRRQKPIKRPKLAGFTAIIDAWLDGDRDVRRNQRHTAKRVFDRLRAEHGFTVSVRGGRPASFGERRIVSALDSGHYGLADGASNEAALERGGEAVDLFCRRRQPVFPWRKWRGATLNANVIFKWLRDPRFAPDPGAALAAESCFLPVEIVEGVQSESGPSVADARDPDGTIEIDVASGHRMRISGRYDPEALARLIRGLSG